MHRCRSGWQFTGRKAGERRRRQTQGCRLDTCVVSYLFERQYTYGRARTLVAR